jgi:hypothetical protein
VRDFLDQLALAIFGLSLAALSLPAAPSGTIEAVRIEDGVLELDGILNEAEWLAAPKAGNPTGARYDALASNNVNRNSNWDGVWQAKTAIDAQGWTCEVAIPFRSISFDPESDVWGFNMSRSIRRKSERGRWRNARPEVRTSMASEAGDILGLSGRCAVNFVACPW